MWEDPESENLFKQMEKQMEIHHRVNTLNKQIDYTSEVSGVIQNSMEIKNSTRLEKIIIVLIFAEVVFYIADKSERWQEFTFEKWWYGGDKDSRTSKAK